MRENGRERDGYMCRVSDRTSHKQAEKLRNKTRKNSETNNLCLTAQAIDWFWGLLHAYVQQYTVFQCGVTRRAGVLLCAHLGVPRCAFALALRKAGSLLFIHQMTTFAAEPDPTQSSRVRI